MDRPVEGLAHRIELASHAAFQLGNASIDPAAHEARFHGQVERIQPQAMKVLVALAERAGQPVSRDELVERCWDGRYVGDDVINRAILLLRRVADRAGGFAIETIPKTGYRLIEQAAKSAGSRRWRWLLALAATGAAILILLIVGRDERYDQPPPPHLALMPFKSDGSKDASALAENTGQTISAMLLDSGFRADLSWPASAKDIASAEYVLSGEVRRNGPDMVAFAYMHDRPTGMVIFSRRFVATGRDVEALPERIGASLASNLSGSLAMMMLDRRQSGDVALRSDMLAQYAKTVEGDNPLEGYQVAVRNAEKWPNVLMPQLSLAFDTGFSLGVLPPDQRPRAVEKARRAADWSLKTAPEFGDTAVPWCLLHPSVWLVECEDRMRAGLQRDPDAPYVPGFLASLLWSVGRYEEAGVFADAGRVANRYKPNQIGRQMVSRYLAGRTDQGDVLFAQAIRWWPRHPDLYWSRLTGLLMAGDLDRVERALDDTPTDIFTLDRDQAAALFAAVRKRDSATARRICLPPRQKGIVNALCLVALGQLDDRDAAFEVAQRHYHRLTARTQADEERLWLADPWVAPDPLLSAAAARPLRNDPRFLPLAERVGLLRYWRTGRLPDFCTRDHEPVCAKFGAAGKAG